MRQGPGFSEKGHGKKELPGTLHTLCRTGEWMVADGQVDEDGDPLEHGNYEEIPVVMGTYFCEDCERKGHKRG